MVGAAVQPGMGGVAVRSRGFAGSGTHGGWGSGIRIWPVTRFSEVTIESLQAVLDEAGTIDFLLIGTGADIAFIPPALRDPLKQAGIAVEGMATGAAARTYNVLVGEDRRVAAALIAVD